MINDWLIKFNDFDIDIMRQYCKYIKIASLSSCMIGWYSLSQWFLLKWRWFYSPQSNVMMNLGIRNGVLDVFSLILLIEISLDVSFSVKISFFKDFFQLFLWGYKKGSFQNCFSNFVHSFLSKMITRLSITWNFHLNTLAFLGTNGQACLNFPITNTVCKHGHDV